VRNLQIFSRQGGAAGPYFPHHAGLGLVNNIINPPPALSLLRREVAAPE
jgi:hypothetical protein